MHLSVKHETIHIYSIRPSGRGAWGAGRGGAGVADDAVPAAGIVAVLPVVAAAAAVASGLVAGQVYTWLSAARRHDGHAEGRRRGRDDGHGVALHLRVHPRGLGGPHHSACGRCRGRAYSRLPCPQRQERRTLISPRVSVGFPYPSGPVVLMSFLCISYVVFMFKT